MLRTITDPTPQELLALRQLRELTQHRKMLLGASATGDLGWRAAANYSPSYRLWETEHIYKVVTKSAKPLVEMGLVKRLHAGYSGHDATRGSTEPTRLGWLYLERRSHLQPSTKEAHNRYEGYACPGCTRWIPKWGLIRKTEHGWCCPTCTLRPLDPDARTTRRLRS